MRFSIQFQINSKNTRKHAFRKKQFNDNLKTTDRSSDDVFGIFSKRKRRRNSLTTTIVQTWRSENTAAKAHNTGR